MIFFCFAHVGQQNLPPNRHFCRSSCLCIESYLKKINPGYKTQGRLFCSSDLFSKRSQNSPFYLPQFFFARCLVEMFVFKLSIGLLGISMYQSDFSILEFGQNSIIVATVEKHKV